MGTQRRHLGSRSGAPLPGPVTVLVVAAVTLAPAAASLADGGRAPLDERRLALLQAADRQLTVADEDTALPRPNLRLREQDREDAHLEKALTIFALMDAGLAGAPRADEANRVLRYSLARWPATEPAHVLGQYARAWNHRSRSLALRIHCLYADRLDADVAAEFRKRLSYMLTGPFERKSENIKFTNNCAYFLAHERLGATDSDTFAQVRAWLLTSLGDAVARGYHEWGSTYNAWTVGALLNLAEFASDREVRDLATRAVDYFLACQSGFCLKGLYCSPAVRRYLHWPINCVEPQTVIAQVLFTGDPTPSDRAWIEWAASNYRPPAALTSLYSQSVPAEALLTTGQHAWRYRCYRGERYAVATAQAPDPRTFVLDTGGTHDVVGCFVQSAAGALNRVVPYGYPPWSGPAKKRNVSECYFGYKNVALVNNGGSTKAVWAGGIVESVPSRLFFSAGFRRILQGGWAFLTDGTIYVAWAPTIGDPVDDPDSDTFTAPGTIGRWLRSTHTPGPEGETSVLEVGDAASYGSFEQFVEGVVARNRRPRLVAGRVSYTAPDGTELRFGPGAATVSGRSFAPQALPMCHMPGIEGHTLAMPGGTVVLDFSPGAAAPRLVRATALVTFGAVAGSPR